VSNAVVFSSVAANVAVCHLQGECVLWVVGSLIYIHPEDGNCNVRSEVLTAASMKMAVFWDVAPCSLVECNCNVCQNTGNLQHSMWLIFES
jgi:hypothetical protein